MKTILKKVILFSVLLWIAGLFYWLWIRPNTYSYETAVKNGDVVMGAGGVANVEKLYVFMENIEHSKVDQIRITAYSKEGNPIIFDLEFNGEIIKCRSDNTRDRYGMTLFKAYGEYTKILKDGRKDYFLIDETGKYEDRWIFQE